MFHNEKSHPSLCSLEDRGDNGEEAVIYVRVIDNHTDRKFNILGIGNHEITSITLMTAKRATSTTSGEVMLIAHQHACHSNNNAIQSSPQTEHYKNIGVDRHVKVGSGQHINNLDKHKITISKDMTFTCLT